MDLNSTAAADAEAMVKQQKQKYRKRVQEAVKALGEDEVARQSSIITRKAVSLAEYQNATSLSIFLSMPGREVATHDIVRQAFRDGKKVYVPYIHPSRSDAKLKIMDMLRLKNEDDLNSLRPDAWGIPSFLQESIHSRENALGGSGCLEDADDNRCVAMKLDLIFMPSVAFDTSLNRLGHGKGFYDRYLTLCQSLSSPNHGTPVMPQLVGLALKEQMLPPGQELPATELDWKVDRVVTPDE